VGARDLLRNGETHAQPGGMVGNIGRGPRLEDAWQIRRVDAGAREHPRDPRAGQSPEQIKATVRASLKSVEAIDIEAITRNAMASVSEAQMERALEAAQDGLDKAQDELDRLDGPQD